MSLFIQRMFDGLAEGSVYALLALALVVVFRSTGQLNFAQGEIGTLSAFFASTFTLSGWPVWLSILAAMVIGFIMAAGVERVVVRPIEHRNPGADRRLPCRQPAECDVLGRRCAQLAEPVPDRRR